MDQQTEFCELPYFWQRTIRNLRRECADSRIKNRELQEDIEDLRIALAALGGNK
ncbi:hypothetical protein [Mycobacteroides immunogenum]|uniref:hypothetical protein n=1 Tax=Mycobacteroides immunogenum TaxID=83262 RepID=UPI0013F4DBCC|nr:hypothetical protein [Mycobacteroides immunogenum]